MDKTALNATVRRLQAERDTTALELARLDLELAGVKASLAAALAADIRASITPAASQRPVSVQRKPGARVSMSELANQSGIQRRAPVEDPAVTAFLARIVKVDFLQEVPEMTPQVLVKSAAATRTIRRGNVTDAHNPGMRTICRAFVRGELPSYCELLRTTSSFAVGQRQRLTRALNDAVDIAILQVYPWLGDGCEMPLTQLELEDINMHCRKLGSRPECASSSQSKATAVSFVPNETFLLPRKYSLWNGVSAALAA